MSDLLKAALAAADKASHNPLYRAQSNGSAKKQMDAAVDKAVKELTEVIDAEIIEHCRLNTGKLK